MTRRKPTEEEAKGVDFISDEATQAMPESSSASRIEQKVDREIGVVQEL